MTRMTDRTMTPLAVAVATQAVALDLLRAELAALSALMPGHDALDPAARQDREARHSAAFEADFDDLPV